MFKVSPFFACIVRFNAFRLIFSRGYVKALVYRDEPRSIDALQDNIQAFMLEILDEMLKTEDAKIGQSA